jgi:hypothetical protein
MLSKGRHRVVPSRGKANGSAKLTDALVEYAKKRYVRGSRRNGYSGIAKDLGVAASTIYREVNGVSW